MTDRGQPYENDRTDFDYEYEEQLSRIERDVTADLQTVRHVKAPSVGSRPSQRLDSVMPMSELKTLETVDNDQTEVKMIPDQRDWSSFAAVGHVDKMESQIEAASSRA